MAIYHLRHASVGRSTHSAGTAGAHVSYITRTGACREVLGEHMPVPRAGERGGEARAWLDEAEASDRKNARVIDKVTLALPLELDPAQRVALVREFSATITGGRVPWVAAIHDGLKDADNPHAHIVIRDRDIETGKRALNLSEKGSTERLREAWEHVCNAALEQAGVEARIDRRTLEAQGIEREPTRHIGPQAQQIEAREPGGSWKLAALADEQAGREAQRAAQKAAEARLTPEQMRARLARIKPARSDRVEAEADATVIRANDAAAEARLAAEDAAEWLGEWQTAQAETAEAVREHERGSWLERHFTHIDVDLPNGRRMDCRKALPAVAEGLAAAKAEAERRDQAAREAEIEAQTLLRVRLDQIEGARKPIWREVAALEGALDAHDVAERQREAERREAAERAAEARREAERAMEGREAEMAIMAAAKGSGGLYEATQALWKVALERLVAAATVVWHVLDRAERQGERVDNLRDRAVEALSERVAGHTDDLQGQMGYEAFAKRLTHEAQAYAARSGGRNLDRDHDLGR